MPALAVSTRVGVVAAVILAGLAAGEPRFAIGAHSLSIGHRVEVVPGLGQRPWVDEDACRWQLTMQVAGDRPLAVLGFADLVIASAITDADEEVRVKPLAAAGAALAREGLGAAPVPIFVLALPVARASYQGFKRLSGSVDVLYGEGEPRQATLPVEARLHAGVEIPGVPGSLITLSDRASSRLVFTLNAAALRVLADVVVLGTDGAPVTPRARSFDARAGNGGGRLSYTVTVPAEAGFALRWHAQVARQRVAFDLAGVSCGVVLPGSAALRGPQRLGADEF